MNSIFTLVGWASTRNHDDFLTELESISIDDLMGSGELINYIDDSLLEAPASLIKRIIRYSEAHRHVKTQHDGLNDLLLN
ncbi:hypothetical protein DWB61_14425 [Ancylomarina euxinus]|uniref:Uncharacterized protein n=1 Tax=Ancylomarina euxinus TaxID=2283627 RepID=A0A425XYE1_9BACT|nr:hypothetical protein [Ancylomarina euxinus]MCZ4695976.1 hypothetical protein [Ancylomarina euxinus]MUP16348.1 hypothetical protein [Ancylomarina euxinus]RRG19741.1 hypothetical protein DWB61_14425 [Ancylomarina euxinus]